MGYDLCVSTVRYIGDLSKFNMVERHKAILEYVVSLSDIDFNNLNWGDFNDDIYEPYYGGEEGDETKRTVVIDIINDFFENHDNRDTTDISIPCGGIFLSGGMSGGDSPSESYDCFWKFDSLPIKILEKGKFGSVWDTYLLFVEEYKNKIPKKLHAELNKWRAAEKI